jgi:regulator of protease activity HflC (stomatin/prohibitin superfamily)
MAAERLTTKEAMERAGVSRHALMRAKKKSELWAETDNKGGLLWDSDALDRWAAERPEAITAITEKQTAPQGWEAVAEARERAAKAEGEVIGLRVALDAAKARAEAAEANADRWRQAAEKRRSWWPFG